MPHFCLETIMQIQPDSAGSPIFGRRSLRPVSSSGSRKPASAPSASAPSASETSSSRETSLLLDQLGEMPDVRADVVDEVRQRLKRGELLTREAAQATAAVILADLQYFLHS